MRQLLGAKKVRFYREKTGLPVVGGLARGGTDHRIDLLLEGGAIAALFRNGEIEIDSSRRWKSSNTPQS